LGNNLRLAAGAHETGDVKNLCVGHSLNGDAADVPDHLAICRVAN
jgi:hypothetical protein